MPLYRCRERSRKYARLKSANGIARVNLCSIIQELLISQVRCWSNVGNSQRIIFDPVARLFCSPAIQQNYRDPEFNRTDGRKIQLNRAVPSYRPFLIIPTSRPSIALYLNRPSIRQHDRCNEPVHRAHREESKSSSFET